MTVMIFTAFFENKRKNRYIQNLYNDSKNNSDTFCPIKSCCNNPTHLLIDDKTVTDPTKLLQHFESNHKKITSEKSQHREDFPIFFYFGSIFDKKFNVSGIITTGNCKRPLKQSHLPLPKAPQGRANGFFYLF